MTGRAKTLVLAALLVLAFAAGWWVNAQRSGAHISPKKRACRADDASQCICFGFLFTYGEN